jgi:hypothetical protein
VTLASAPSGPQPDPCFAQKAHTSFHTGNSTWPSHVLFSRRGGKKKKTCKGSHYVVFKVFEMFPEREGELRKEGEREREREETCYRNGRKMC